MKNKKEEPLKPKASAPPLEVDDFSSAEDSQDRITEKLSISVPTQPLLRPSGLGRYFNKNVHILLRDGNIMDGFLQSRQWDYLHLLNIVETGKDEKLTADWCGVGVDGVSRIYPANAKVEKISKPVTLSGGTEDIATDHSTKMSGENAPTFNKPAK